MFFRVCNFLQDPTISIVIDRSLRVFMVSVVMSDDAMGSWAAYISVETIYLSAN